MMFWYRMVYDDSARSVWRAFPSVPCCSQVHSYNVDGYPKMYDVVVYHDVSSKISMVYYHILIDVQLESTVDECDYDFNINNINIPRCSMYGQVYLHSGHVCGKCFRIFQHHGAAPWPSPHAWGQVSWDTQGLVYSSLTAGVKCARCGNMWDIGGITSQTTVCHRLP